MAMSATERKRVQRQRDKQSGGRFEKTYRATAEEHEKLCKFLADIRAVKSHKTA